MNGRAALAKTAAKPAPLSVRPRSHLPCHSDREPLSSCHSDRVRAQPTSPVIPTEGGRNPPPLSFRPREGIARPSGGILRASVSHKYRLHSAIQKDFVTKAQRARPLDCARGDRVEGIKKHLRKQNHAFAPAHTICREALGGKVNAPRVLKKACPQMRGAEENPAASLQRRRPAGLSFFAENRRRRRAEIFASMYKTPRLGLRPRSG